MTPAEQEILELLVEAHNKYVRLPIQHPDDVKDWVNKLHDLTRVIMVRPTVRKYPEIFLNNDF